PPVSAAPPRWAAWAVVLCLVVPVAIAIRWLLPSPSLEDAQALWIPFSDAHSASDETESAGGRRLPKRIRVRKENQDFFFVFIPEDRKQNLPPFYILETKVTNEQFRSAVNDKRFKECLTKLKSRQPLAVLGNWEGLALDGKWPVRGVTVIEAHCFAEWLGG